LNGWFSSRVHVVSMEAALQLIDPASAHPCFCLRSEIF
jgi:hypothetical protein